MTDKVLKPVRPSVGIKVAYQKKLLDLIDEMDASFLYWLTSTYRANEPEMAQDALPSTELKIAIKKLARRWQRKFDLAAPQLAEYFALSVNKRSATMLRKILKEAGIAVEFKMTHAQRDVFNATVSEQVGLIKSIPQKYLTEVQGAVMRSVASGRKLSILTKDLQKYKGITQRRAAFIARDQNNKATATLTRVKQVELGITEAEWVHSAGGHTPRPTHVSAGKRKQRYDVRKGWWDPQAVKKKGGGFQGQFIFPGELINCKCVSRSVVRGFK